MLRSDLGGDAHALHEVLPRAHTWARPPKLFGAPAGVPMLAGGIGRLGTGGEKIPFPPDPFGPWQSCPARAPARGQRAGAFPADPLVRMVHGVYRLATPTRKMHQAPTCPFSLACIRPPERSSGIRSDRAFAVPGVLILLTLVQFPAIRLWLPSSTNR